MYPSANYYNTVPNPVSVYYGYVRDLNGQPIKDALIRGSNNTWTLGTSTFSKSDGSFSLQANFPITVVQITGLGYITNDIIYSPTNPINVNLGKVTCGLGNRNHTITSNENTEISDEIESVFKLYPNPNNGLFTLVNNSNYESGFVVEVINVLGKSVLRKEYNQFDSEQIDISDYNNGFYFIQISSGNYREVKKVIKK